MEENRLQINGIVMNGKQVEAQRKNSVGFYFVFIQDTNLDLFKNKCRACDSEFYTMFRVIKSCPICGYSYQDKSIEKEEEF